MQHHELRKWLIIMIVAFIALLGLALSIQRPQSLSSVPLFAPSPTPTPVASENIIVTSPQVDESITQTFEVRGSARVFENVVTIRLKEKLSGQVYGETQAIADAPDTGQFGDFRAGIKLTDPNLRTNKEFIVEVFQYSAKDGSEVDKVSIPVRFVPMVE